MYYQPSQTCRFCKQSDWQGTQTMVHYSTRHYAHYRCYLKAGKPLADLRDWQIVQFPYYVVKEYGQEAVAMAASDRIEADRRKSA